MSFRVYTAEQAADYCGIALNTLYKLSSLGQFAVTQYYGRKLGYFEQDLDAWVRENWRSEKSAGSVKGENNALPANPAK